jgi:16S rRNA (guanine527-N7)-methyltransferase
VETARIAELLGPFLGEEPLKENQLTSISTYIDVLLKWNARMNLTAVREPEQIVTRHFGESLFAARQLLRPESAISIGDVGSGAGFPGLPLKICSPGLQLALIEAHGKKATFLREAVRALRLTDVRIVQERAERISERFELVTLRAVEKFEAVLPAAAELVGPGGRLALLVGSAQASAAEEALGGGWEKSVPIPESRERVLKIRGF